MMIASWSFKPGHASITKLDARGGRLVVDATRR
jgi:hypothetical protein